MDNNLVQSFGLIFNFLKSSYLNFFGYNLSLFDILLGLIFVGVLGFIFYKIFD